MNIHHWIPKLVCGDTYIHTHTHTP